ncbi:acyl-CoA dehydrogenase family protein [Aneurinibacillus danicus]|jgi:alkylation response protein AidB-like acyl-CoA dehydrogenase|uniref:Dibenzothiophene monooxygenase n=1 Tax=Aneurinibacillus danicus TaxID=267746 RepID=A0A511VBR9_9BACL|nr:acyl-CoA dehydrogenase family protein [Aneurinibacillus danicus]GEN36294.1 FMNH2-dependent monooxygenase [Aneurinibacillus danicus]
MSVTLKKSEDFIAIAAKLAAEFAVDVKERDHIGGTPKAQRDALRKSGLLKLLIPEEYGGYGESWITVLHIVRELAKVDGSIAHLFGYHTLFLANLFFSGTNEQKLYYFTETADKNLFWGNAVNPLDHSLFAVRDGERLILNGKKSFSTGSPDSDFLLISWEEENNPTLFMGIIPSDRTGVTIHDDWDGIGQRQTGSGTVTFENVIVEKGEVLPGGYYGTSPFSTLGATFSQSVLLNIFLGIAEGALEAAKQYTVTHSKPWYTSGYEKATDDPSIQSKYGYYWIRIQSAIGLADRAAEKAAQAWDKQFDLTEKERGETAVLVAAANVLAGEVSIEVTNGIFEVMGARSASRKHNFDRYWRDVRTHTLHNPAEYKRRTVGKWFLNGEFPIPGEYA